MFCIHTSTLQHGRVTVHKVIGNLDPAALVSRVIEYNRGTVSPRTVWDIREARLEGFDSRAIEDGVRETGQHMQQVEGRRTAWVASRPLEFGLMRMAEAFSERHGHPEVAVFYDFDQALEWLERK